MRRAFTLVVMRYWTFRLRLTVLYGAVFLLAGVLLLGVTYVLVQQRLDRQAVAYAQQRDALWTSQNVPLIESRQRITLGDGRTVTARQLAEGMRAERERYRRETLDAVLTQGGLALGAVGVLAALAGWLVAGRGLRPINRITETARRIADSADRALHERIDLHGPPDEIKELADTFDLMLERLDRSFDGQRRFVASASHEMRTPLAVNRALIEVAMTRPHASPDAVELGRSLLNANLRHERLIDGLLTLAGSENQLTERHPIDLADIVHEVLLEAAPAAERAGVTIHPPRLGEAVTMGDPYLLERIVQNLVENAIRHNGADGGWLAARTWTEGGRARLEVANTGAVIHRYETEALFQPFRRLRGPRTAARPGSERGFGLGLAIVRAIAGAHGGEARAEARPEGGLVVTVGLPARGPSPSHDRAVPGTGANRAGGGVTGYAAVTPTGRRSA
jgi:signal transduction histidine kinase